MKGSYSALWLSLDTECLCHDRSLGVPRHTLRINHIREGSVIVEFTIMPDEDEEEAEGAGALPLSLVPSASSSP